MKKQVNNPTDRHDRSPLVFVDLVVFNNSGDIISCLKSLKEQTFTRFEIVIVDNASNSTEVNHITSFINRQTSGIQKIHFIKNERNLGYSGGNNVGIKYALEHGASEILILNPDTTADTYLLEEMHNVLVSDSKVGIVGPVIDEGNRKIAGGKISWLKPELNHTEERSRYDFLTGACFLVKSEVFEKVGLFDERYFLYFEDADFCVRARKAGYQLVTAENALLHHKVSATTSKLGSARLLRYHYRNTHVFNMKNAPIWAFILLPFWSILIIIKQLLKLAVGRDKVISKEILLGVLDFYRGRFGKI